MFVRTLDELEALGRIRFPADKSFRSARFLTADDGMGFSYNENRVSRGTTLDVWLKNHWEANYIVSGRGEVTDFESGKTWRLEAGVLYVVGPNDRHRLHFTEDECHLSVFFPPLTGNERFDADGSYEPSGPIEKTDRRMFVKRADDLRRAGQEIATDDSQMRRIDMLTADDDVGFDLSDMRLKAGADVTVHCENQPQACHVISGAGEVIDLKSGASWAVEPSMTISAPPTDQFRLCATTDIHLLNVVSQTPPAAVISGSGL